MDRFLTGSGPNSDPAPDINASVIVSYTETADPGTYEPADDIDAAITPAPNTIQTCVMTRRSRSDCLDRTAPNGYQSKIT